MSSASSSSSGDQSSRAREVFDEAIQRAPAERAGFIDRACAGDEALRAEVRGLMAAMQAAGEAGFLTTPTVASPSSMETLHAPVTEGPGTRIGPYKILQLIGEGGFGSVFMAEQSKPVQRRVALKIIKLGMDTKQVIARFEAERQALAMMDHPNIAKVLDAGATDAGRPYFVMELVAGEPITDYCDRHNLGIEQRLELFAQVCNAVQHSHQKGIIHRDIKPSNILVSTQDGRPFAKILDFGIAKATAARLTEKTLFTEHRTLIGTPEYMSPEQAEGTLDIDTRTDVYSLGVLLYELLTGATPFDSEKLRSAAYGELQRIIREVDPPRPSTRLSENTDTIGNVAARRQTEPRKLNSIIRGELDWIVMKALEKDRARRYETANGLSADIQRYLAGEAVVAAPPSAAYRLKKFVRRHKGLVTATSVVAATLVIGIVGTTWGLVQAERARSDAVAEARRADTAAKAESEARQRAESISEFVTTALRSSDAAEAGGRQDTTILQAMDQAIADVNSGRFADDPPTDAKLRETISIILRNNGDLIGAEQLAAQALDINRRIHPIDDPALARSINMLAKAREALGRDAEAETLTAESLAMYQRLYPGDQTDVAALLNNLGALRRDLGRADDALPLIQQALAMHERLHPGDNAARAMILDNLAQTLEDLGRAAEAEEFYVRALDMRQREYAGDRPDLAVGMNNLAGLRVTLGRTDQALPLFEQALAMRRRLFKGDHPAVAESLSNFAAALMQTSRPEAESEAEPLIEEALQMNRRLFTDDHPNTAHALYTLAALRLRLGRPADAEPMAKQGVEMQRRLQTGDHVPLAMTLVLLGRVEQSLKRWDEAWAAFDEGVAMLRRLMPDGSPQLARSLWQSGTARLESGNTAAALPEIEEALTMAEKALPDDSPALQEYRATLEACRQALSSTSQPASSPAATPPPVDSGA